MNPGNGRSEGCGRKATRRGDTLHTAHDAPLEMPDRSRAEPLHLHAAGAQAGTARARDDRPARGGGAEKNTGGVVRGSDRPVVQTHAVVWFVLTQQGQYSQGAGTQRKTSPAPATGQTDGNDGGVAPSDSRVAASSRKRRTRTRAASSGSCSKPLYQSGCSNPTWNTRSPANVSRSPPDARRTTLCPGVWPPVRR